MESRVYVQFIPIIYPWVPNRGYGEGINWVYSKGTVVNYTRFEGIFVKGINRVYVLFGGYIPDVGIFRAFHGYIEGIYPVKTGYILEGIFRVYKIGYFQGIMYPFYTRFIPILYPLSNEGISGYKMGIKWV